MTVKELKAKQMELDDLIRKQAKKCGLTTNGIDPIFDGIADEEGYLNSRLKVAWVLKEPYDDFDINGKPCGGGWSLVKDCLLNHDENWVTKDGRKQWTNPVWQKMAYVMYGFRHGQHWNEMEWIRNNPSMMDEIKSIAWINVNKMPAYTNSCNGNYRYQYETVWKDIVKKQFDVYAPDVVIFGYTFHCFRGSFGASLIEESSNDWVTHYRIGKQHLLDTYHPGRKGGGYVDSVIDMLNEISMRGE